MYKNQMAAHDMKQVFIDLKGDTDSNTIIVGDLITPLTSMDKLTRQNSARKAATELNQTYNRTK